MRQAFVAVSAVLLCAAPASAGKLDLDFRSSVRVPQRQSQSYAPAPLEWKPGDPRNLRGESKAVRAAVPALNLGLGIAGFAACLAAAPAAAAGFAVVAAISAYRLYKASSV